MSVKFVACVSKVLEEREHEGKKSYPFFWKSDGTVGHASSSKPLHEGDHITLCLKSYKGQLYTTLDQIIED